MALSLTIGLFIGLSVVIGLAGTKLVKGARELADRTRIGQAMVGGIILGAITSISGITTSVTAAAMNHPELAISNAIGGIAAQTVFLAIADITYLKATLAHAAASLQNLMQGVLLIVLLVSVLVLNIGPDISFSGIHPGTFLIVGIYILGVWFISRAKKRKMWRPKKTELTVKHNVSKKSREVSLWKILPRFILFAVIVAVAGYLLARIGINLASQTGLSETIVGGLFTAISTSLPELMIALIAVKQKALNMAVGNIIGGNTFDVLFLVFADLAFLRGSIFHAITQSHLLLIIMTLLLTGILLMGMLYRKKYGLGKVGWESIATILVFIGGYVMLFYM